MNKTLFDFVADSNSESSLGASSDTYDEFLNSDAHIVEYLFTDQYYRNEGYAATLLLAMEEHCRQIVRCHYSFSNNLQWCTFMFQNLIALSNFSLRVNVLANVY